MDHHCDLQKDLTKSIHEFICRHHERPDSSERSKEPLLATHSELIIMALVDMERPASAEDINLWVTRHFGTGYRGPPAERLLTIGSLLTSAFDLPVVEIPSEPQNEELGDQTLSEYGLTVQIMAEHGSVPDRTLPELMRWTAPIRDAAPFLRRRLFSPWSPDKTFPIMELPVELREHIFKYALLLPPGATMKPIQVHRDSRRRKFIGERELIGYWVISKPACKWFVGRWAISAPRWHPTSKRHDIEPESFALLRVSKAIYEEAIPFFWSQNLLVSSTAWKLRLLLEPTMGWKYVEQIKLELEVYRSPHTPQREMMSHEDKCIAVLASMPRLRKLVICLSPVAGWRRKSEGEVDVLSIPSVASLRKHVRGLKELVVHGMLKELEDILRAELMGPRKMSGTLI